MLPSGSSWYVGGARSTWAASGLLWLAALGGAASEAETCSLESLQATAVLLAGRAWAARQRAVERAS